MATISKIKRGVVLRSLNTGIEYVMAEDLEVQKLVAVAIATVRLNTLNKESVNGWKISQKARKGSIIVSPEGEYFHIFMRDYNKIIATSTVFVGNTDGFELIG